MSYIVGTSLPKDKNLAYSLCRIYGLGFYQSKIICDRGGFGTDCLPNDLNPNQIKDLSKLVESMPVLLGQDLRRFNSNRVKHLVGIASYRGLRHRKGLPVRGQRTHTNAKKRSAFK
uniref:Ribosomal protein S13 n=1 Tax=Dictyopteris divaricata TaxID=156996 RepID=A0A4Y5T810_9PHAE|nr:ribosomal protein S13 [Dictyopteris divaricata]QDB64129.1 ribosomal protein S13 [Dictyopteris divaricata]